MSFYTDRYGNRLESPDSNRKIQFVQCKNIVLDLDNTLLQCIPQKLWNQLYLNNFKTLMYSKFYVIILRPNLYDFLKYVFTNFKVAIWTSGSSEFLNFILTEIFFKFDWIPHVSYSYNEYHDCLTQRGLHKDIEYLCERNNWNTVDTIIIDDSTTVALSNDTRCIQISPFIVYEKNNNKSKNKSYFGPFETMYAEPENLTLNTESKYDTGLLDCIKTLQTAKTMSVNN